MNLLWNAWNDHQKMVLSLSVGLASGAAWYFLANKQRKKKPIPTEWEEIGEVSNFFIYPLKSSKPISVQSVNATKSGLREGQLADRSFLILNEKGQMITGRDCRPLVTLSTAFENDTLTVTTLDGASVSVNVSDVMNRNKEITNFCIRGDPVEGTDCGDEVAQWLSKILYNDQKKVRLMYIGSDDWKRKKKEFPYYDFQQFYEDDSTRYFDYCSYMFMNKSSLSDLNSRVSKQVHFGYFRPSIVVSGPKAWDEDTWEFVKIGDSVVFHINKPCERCILTTIDPSNGEYSKEHFDELLKYRTPSFPPKLAKEWKKKPVFGVHAGIDVTGRVHVGDKVYVSRAKTPLWVPNILS